MVDRGRRAGIISMSCGSLNVARVPERRDSLEMEFGNIHSQSRRKRPRHGFARFHSPHSHPNMSGTADRKTFSPDSECRSHPLEIANEFYHGKQSGITLSPNLAPSPSHHQNRTIFSQNQQPESNSPITTSRNNSDARSPVSKPFLS
jgi:hypothetical protein